VRAARAARAPLVALATASLATSPLVAQSGGARSEPPPVLGARDAWIGAAFGLGALAIAPFDHGIAIGSQRPDLQRNRALHRTAVVFRHASQPGAYLALGTAWAAGRIGGNERLAEAGLRGVEAVTVGLVATGAVKLLAGRTRPYVDKARPHDFAFARGFRGSHSQSFPSGHTTVGFATAAGVTSTVAAHSPGARWPLGAALYGSATLMGLARIYEDRHWASDVVGGAAVGTLSGLAVSRYHRTRPGGRVDRWLLGASLVPRAGGGADVRPIILPAR
jgi:membrane-associated phospholipid phosphatase